MPTEEKLLIFPDISVPESYGAKKLLLLFPALSTEILIGLSILKATLRQFMKRFVTR